MGGRGAKERISMIWRQAKKVEKWLLLAELMATANVPEALSEQPMTCQR
jgi:hypothetical protein